MVLLSSSDEDEEDEQPEEEEEPDEVSPSVQYDALWCTVWHQYVLGVSKANVHYWL